MKRPMCRLISVAALLVLCSIGTSNASNRHAGVHTGPHWSSATMYETLDTALAVEAKTAKKHAGNGGKHDSGVDGTHPDKTSKADKQDEMMEGMNGMGGTGMSMGMGTGGMNTANVAADDSWGTPSHPNKDAKSSKTSGTTTKAPTVPPASMSYAKTHKDPNVSDSKADKGVEAKSYKPAPNEYNGVKMVVKTPEGGYKQSKAGKDPIVSTGGETVETVGISSAKPLTGTKSGKVATGESGETVLIEANSTTTVEITELPPDEQPPPPAETTTTEATEASPPAATTPPATTTSTTAAAVEEPVVETRSESPPEETYPTYSPTTLYEETSSVEETFTAMDPFGLRFLSSKQQPRFDLEKVTTVTMEHLLHSFRTKGWDADRLKLMLLDEEDDRRRNLRKLVDFPVYELVFGGILYFKSTTEMPTKEEENALVEESFSGARLRYYINLLKEEGVDVASASWGHLATSSEPTGGSNKLGVILGSVFGSIGLVIVVALLVRLYNKRTRRIEDGSKPASLVFRIKEEVESIMDSHRDNSTIPSSIEQNEARSRYSFYTKQPLIADPVSPLDSPDDTASTNTRYVSVFTVKKDCGDKPLEEVDLRSLAVAYLSRLFKKVPDTSLLPYDKDSTLPAIKSIRNIPDDLQELLEYVGNPRIDENTGKVLFNLRCESDVPMSKMKNLSSAKLPKQMSKSTVNEDRSAASGFEDVSL